MLQQQFSSIKLAKYFIYHHLSQQAFPVLPDTDDNKKHNGKLRSFKTFSLHVEGHIEELSPFL